MQNLDVKALCIHIGWLPWARSRTKVWRTCLFTEKYTSGDSSFNLRRCLVGSGWTVQQRPGVWRDSRRPVCINQSICRCLSSKHDRLAVGHPSATCWACALVAVLGKVCLSRRTTERASRSGVRPAVLEHSSSSRGCLRQCSRIDLCIVSSVCIPHPPCFGAWASRIRRRSRRCSKRKTLPCSSSWKKTTSFKSANSSTRS